MIVTTAVLACCAAFWALLAILWRSKSIPSHLPWVGQEDDGYLRTIRSYLRSIAGTHELLEEGYNKFSKEGLPFVLPILFTGAEIMLPPCSLNWIHDQPSNILSGFEAHREFMRADWTLLHPTIIHEHIFQTVISKQLTRHLDELEDELRAEIPIALGTHITPNGNDWHEVDGYKSWKKTILQVVSRVYVGEALCESWYRRIKPERVQLSTNLAQAMIRSILAMQPTSTVTRC
nr:cytochrome p450 monooxygenase tenb [Quercus suber]